MHVWETRKKINFIWFSRHVFDVHVPNLWWFCTSHDDWSKITHDNKVLNENQKLFKIYVYVLKFSIYILNFLTSAFFWNSIFMFKWPVQVVLFYDCFLIHCTSFNLNLWLFYDSHHVLRISLNLRISLDLRGLATRSRFFLNHALVFEHVWIKRISIFVDQLTNFVFFSLAKLLEFFRLFWIYDGY